ncbi:V-type ATP synthase subunit I domain-containing protein [Ferruginibacter albus]|uniref:hypothetical protein n=1 Tax=Ferruginibacter albus TaxID=2875540 RepID=UPI001CC7FC4C|nr:hypothetical protein [Ferruginibacter albus]UAY52529.1 hypothetical protein K9M53_02285 [Ferruginibacter albus]
MEQTKLKLTQLINTINESFPDENDLKGFLGISRALITDILIQSDALLIPLKEYDNNFETIILKRELAEVFEKINKELESKFDNITPSKFEIILRQITRIKSLIKDTYLSVIDSLPMRTEVEIIQAKQELALLTSNIEDLKKINIDLTTLKDELTIKNDTILRNIDNVQEEITTIKESTVKNINTIHEEVNVLKGKAEKIIVDFEDKQQKSSENEKKINEYLIKIETEKTSIEAIQKNTSEWEQEIKATKEQIVSNLNDYKALNLKSKTLQSEIEATHDKIFGKKDSEGNQINGYLQETEDLKNKIAAFLAEQNTRFLAQFTEIEGLLPGATSTGLAEAYQIQKASYKKPLQFWSVIFISTICIMTALSIVLLYFQFNAQTTLTLNQAFISLLKDLPFFIPTIWLAGYASKQQSQYKRLQEEYAFKETNAKSFHGHKMQIEELMKDGITDQDVLLQLVGQLVIITSQNPSVTLDNKSHEDSPPIFKLAEKFLPFKKKNEEEKQA